MSKKFLFTVTLVIAITSSYAFATAQPYCELGANHTRLDMGNANLATRVSNGNWLVINNHAGDWGNSACQSGGGDCCTGDWFTWWYAAAWEPAPCRDCEPGPDMRGLVPVKFDPETKGYIWGPPSIANE